MWAKVHGVSVRRSVIAVATRLGFLDPSTGHAVLREFGEIPNNPVDAVEWAVQAGGLVLTETPRQAFWAKREVTVDWVNQYRSWVFFWEFARQSKVGLAVDSTLYGARKSDDPKRRKWRLVRLEGFPTVLAQSRARRAGDLPIKSAGRPYPLVRAGCRRRHSGVECLRSAAGKDHVCNLIRELFAA